MAVVVNYVVAPVVFDAKVNVGGIDDGDAPQVFGDDIVADIGLVVFVHAVDADAAAAVHRVGFKVVLVKGVSDDG